MWAAVGAVLAAGAPLGLLVLRAVQTDRSLGWAWVSSQVQSDPALYLYLTVATTCVMVVCGYSIGRYEDRLRLRSLTDPLTAAVVGLLVTPAPPGAAACFVDPPAAERWRITR